ncbi:MAG: type II secretion system F family protein [Deltaproteobacteria bacterium]|nr:type II secretion system F family protein [Deltaproteobacteria bacterium]
MPPFTYTAIDQNGLEIKGLIEAADKDSAAENISSKGLYPIDITQSTSYLTNIRKRLMYRNIKRPDIIEFASNLALMLRAGVSITDALNDLGKTADQKQFGEMLLDIKNNIEMGISFSDALRAHEAVFPDMLIRLTAVGEETGAIEKSLQDVAAHLQRIEDLVAAIKRALIYPAFAFVSTGGALFFWIIYVLPQLLDAFTGMGMKIPAITLMLMHISSFTQAYWKLLPVFIVAVIVTIKMMRRFHKTNYFLDLALLKMPIVKLLIHNKLVALFAEQLRILLVAGITIDRALEIVAEVIGNQVFKATILETMENIKAGSRISDSLRKSGLFPSMVLRMIDIGEKSGSLDVQLEHLAEHYLKMLDDLADKFGKMLEPIIIMVIGVIFIIIIAGILLPVYDLISGFEV